MAKGCKFPIMKGDLHRTGNDVALHIFFMVLIIFKWCWEAADKIMDISSKRFK